MSTPLPTTLGCTLRAKRRQLKLTQQFVADQMHMARTTIVAIEAGSRRLRVEEATRLAQILQIEISTFLSESERMKEHRLTLTGSQARIIERLTARPLDPILAKVVQNLYNEPQIQEAIASTLIHLLIQHEDETSNPEVDQLITSEVNV